MNLFVCGSTLAYFLATLVGVLEFILQSIFGLHLSFLTQHLTQNPSGAFAPLVDPATVHRSLIRNTLKLSRCHSSTRVTSFLSCVSTNVHVPSHSEICRASGVDGFWPAHPQCLHVSSPLTSATQFISINYTISHFIKPWNVNCFSKMTETTKYNYNFAFIWIFIT